MENIIVKKQGAVATIQLNRESSLNSLNQGMIDELYQVLDELERDKGTKVLVVHGNDKVFCAGADIADTLNAKEGDSVFWYNFSKKYQSICGRIESFRIPVIAAISGHALGGGCELALACDIRIASETARLGLPEVLIGGLPGGGGTQRLPRLIGAGLAKQLLYTGRSLKAEEALRVGLVNEVYPVSEYLAAALNLAQEISTKPLLALEAMKRLVNEGLLMDFDSALESEAKALSTLSMSADAAEGRKAFFEKRPPQFKDC